MISVWLLVATVASTAALSPLDSAATILGGGNSLLQEAAMLGGGNSLLQEDLLSVLSWALLDIPPSSRAACNATLQAPQVEDLKEPAKEVAPLKRKKRTITFQGWRPILKLDVRFLKMKLFKIHKKTSLGVYFGTGVKAYLDDLLRLKGSRSSGDDFLFALEDMVSMTGVDGSACVQRLLCDLGAVPSLRMEGFFRELLDLGIGFMRGSGADTESTGRSSAPRGKYLDAVGAGRDGKDCVLQYAECPISLFSVLRQAQS